MIKEIVEEWRETTLIGTTRKFVKDPKQALVDFIKKSDIEDLFPFQAGSGPHWSGNQIRIPKKEYENLKKKTQDILKKYAIPPVDDNNVYEGDSEAKKLYETTWYWKNCDAYIFRYDVEAYWIEYRGAWGYEGMEDGTTIEFISCDKYPPIIMRNLNCNEGVAAKKRFRGNLEGIE